MESKEQSQLPDKIKDNVYYDKNGKEIREFDLLKVFHFIGARRKKHYMYKWIRIKDGYFVGDSLSHCGHTFRLRSVANKNNIIEDGEIIQRGGKNEI